MNKLDLIPIGHAIQPAWSLDVHPELTVVVSGVEHGNVDRRFSDEAIASERRLRLLGYSGCNQLAYLMPECVANFEDLDDFDLTGQQQEIIGDGLITTRLGRGLALATADCAVLKLYAPEQKILAIAHIGREGAVLGLAPKMLDYMRQQYNVNPRRIRAHFSPAIAPESYILPELRGALQDKTWKPFCKETNEGFMVDFVGFAEHQLRGYKVKPSNITGTKVDVRTDKRFFSHVEREISGRKIAAGRNGFIVGMKA